MFILSVITISVLYSTVSAVDMSAVQPYNFTASAMFATEDLNGDGIMTVAEIDATFNKYDLNGDGKESRREYTTLLCSLNPSLYMLSHYLYDDYDVNGDHMLDLVDYEGFHAKMDTDKNQEVTEAEFVVYWVALFEATEVKAAQHQHGNSHEHGSC